MAVLDTSYLSVDPTPIKDFSDYLGSNFTEIPRLKSLVSSIKSVFKAQDVQLQFYFIEGRRYKIDVFTSRMKKTLVSSIYYIPTLDQVHIYDNNWNMILASSKKKVIFSSIPYTLDYIGAADKFKNILFSI